MLALLLLAHATTLSHIPTAPPHCISQGVSPLLAPRVPPDGALQQGPGALQQGPGAQQQGPGAQQQGPGAQQQVATTRAGGVDPRKCPLCRLPRRLRLRMIGITDARREVARRVEGVLLVLFAVMWWHAWHWERARK